MKICFIWVDEFRNFENFGFNLSSSFKFSYHFRNNTITKKKFSPLPDNFFGENIIDVVGLIGKNGAGKSNALELVCKLLKGGKTSLRSDFLIITEEAEELTCHYSFTNKAVPSADFEIEFQSYDGFINPLKVIFFSNVFDERQNDFDSEVADISVNNLIGRGFTIREGTSSFEQQMSLINSRIFPSLNIDLPTKVQFIKALLHESYTKNGLG